MNASCVTSSTSAESRTNRDSKPSQLALVLKNQQLEGTLVATLRALDELLIDFAITHPIPESFVVMPAERRVRHPASSPSAPDPDRRLFRGMLAVRACTDRPRREREVHPDVGLLRCRRTGTEPAADLSRTTDGQEPPGTRFHGSCGRPARTSRQVRRGNVRRSVRVDPERPP